MSVKSFPVLFGSSVTLRQLQLNCQKGKTYLDIFHPLPLVTLFPPLTPTPHRLTTTTSNLRNPSNSPNATSVTPPKNLKNKNLKHGNTFSSNLALLFQTLKTSSLIIEVCLVDPEDPTMFRETRFGRVDRECKEELVSVIEEIRVREVR
jgi:hypothetical protein